ncbi:hypothetical protein [Aureibacillus halotolerans]|uniref:YqzN/YkzM domain-containing protein n=1 Tax=Aureibacillus halotolerans TaxID=1508390 RepID=A0A4R6TQQ5_9BACI|nr:hypothetical protein [Aureibacillus halotolerans]TDQ35281.1 hypothetical protein EV213_12268 [Aureibacillus halotolerans]
MSEKTNEKKEAPKAEASAEGVFSVEQLKEHSQKLFDVQPEVLSGALHGVTGELTKAHALLKLNGFLKKKI